MLKRLKFVSQQKNIFFWLVTVALLLVGTNIFAATNTAASGGLGDMAVSMEGALSKFKALIGTGSYVVGLGFAIGAIMKFKQHKDNPSNIPVGTPVALLFVAIALVFLPSIVSMTGSTASLTTTGEGGTFKIGSVAGT